MVEVKKEEVLTRIRANRDQHRSIYEQAVEGYRKRAIETMEQMIADARKGGEIRQSIHLPVPEDHTEDYDRVIDMLDMEVKATVELSEQEFAWYVRDDWSWKAAFLHSTVGMGYIGEHGALPGQQR
jgi:hypothetical protein